MTVLAAFDFPDLKTVIGLVVAGIWVVNHIFGNRAKNEADAPKPAPRSPRPARAARADQTEIDQFLEEMLGPRKSPPQGKPVVLRPAQPPPLAQPLSVRPEPLQSGNRGRRGQGSAKRGGAEPHRQRPPRRPEHLASDMLQDVQQHMRMGEGRPPASVAAVASAATGVRRAAPALSALTALLTSPEDVRQAIVLAEILGPPVSRRRR